jgi:hypothetical protein
MTTRVTRTAATLHVAFALVAAWISTAGSLAPSPKEKALL